MILTQIYLPCLEKSYDFQLDESLSVGELITGILSIIAGSERMEFSENGEFSLCFMDGSGIFDPKCCLYQYGVKSGSRLMLV